MTRTLIACVLVTSTLMLNSAYAHSPNKAHWHSHASNPKTIAALQARAETRDLASPRPTVLSSSHDRWEDRSVFYQGPTYVGRY
jgi:hypothetical protein